MSEGSLNELGSREEPQHGDGFGVCSPLLGSDLSSKRWQLAAALNQALEVSL